MSIFNRESHFVEYQIFAEDDGYAVFREGVKYDLIPYELVRVYVDDNTLLESWLSGTFAYQTNALPPNLEV